MKICDVCRKTVTNLNPGPPEREGLEICGDCFQNMLARFRQVEQRLIELKAGLRVEAIEAWQRERTRPPG